MQSFSLTADRILILYKCVINNLLKLIPDGLEERISIRNTPAFLVWALLPPHDHALTQQSTFASLITEAASICLVKLQKTIDITVCRNTRSDGIYRPIILSMQEQLIE